MKGHQAVSPPVAVISAVAGAFLVGLVAGRAAQSEREAAADFAVAPTAQSRVAAPAPEPAADPELVPNLPSGSAVAPLPRAVPGEPRILPFAMARLPVPRNEAAAPPRVAPPGVVPAKAEVPKVLPLDALVEVHTLPVRIDLRPAEELERELLMVPEIDLDNRTTPYLADQLFTTARANNRAGQPPPSIVLACKMRPDLAGLPFRVGVEAVLPRERAAAMHQLSRYLRGTYQSMMTARQPRPEIDRFYQVLTAERAPWAVPESVPCIQQILLAEDAPTRRMSCELLRELKTGQATEALARVAVFDSEPANRAAAVDALRDRDEAEVVRLLVPFLRYPWPRAVEHACEALIALQAKSAIPALAVAHDLPDPDASFRMNLPGDLGGSFRRELVRINHARNCTMCHTPSLHRSDSLRAYAPVATPTTPIQVPLPPRMTMGYYSAPQVRPATVASVRRPPSPPTFVSATTTYLRQDFSLDQPVANPGIWPARQRYDYFLRISPGAGGPVLRKPEESPYRQAIALAIWHLTGRKPDLDQEWLAEQKLQAPMIEDLTGAVARVMLLTSYPSALIAVSHPSFADNLLLGKPQEIEELVERLQKDHGPVAARLALMAYFDRLARRPVKAIADRAGRFLEITRGPTLDSTLARAMKDAAADQ